MKKRATTYTFDASAKTIDCALFTSLEAIQLITNVTDNIIIYNFADATKGGSLASTTLTLTYDTTSMADTDKLQILVEDGATTDGVTLSAETTKVIGTVNVAAGQSIAVTNAGITTIAGAVSGTEMQCDIASISAGDNNIGNVDVVTLPGVAGDVAAGATDSGNPIKVGGKYNATLPTLTDGQRGDVQLTPRGSMRVVITDTSTNAAGLVADNADGVTVSASTNKLAVVGKNHVFNGSSWDRMYGGTGGLYAQGAIAHDGGDSGNPIKVGGHATASVSGETAVAASDRTDLYAGLDGILITRPHTNLEDIVTGNASNTDGASTQCIAAQAAGIKTYLTDITLTNTSSTAVYVEIKDGTTVKWTFPVPAGGGVTHSFTIPIPGSAATAWNFDSSASATTIYCSMAGFKSRL